MGTERWWVQKLHLEKREREMGIERKKVDQEVGGASCVVFLQVFHNSLFCIWFVILIAVSGLSGKKAAFSAEVIWCKANDHACLRNVRKFDFDTEIKAQASDTMLLWIRVER